MAGNFLIYLSKLTLRKIINSVIIYFAYLFSKITKRVIIRGLPSSISIEPTCKCNLKCPECPTGSNLISRQTEKIDFSLYKKIVTELAPVLTYLNLYLQGEPFLHPEIFDLISYANKKRIYTDISTNGHFLTHENAKKIVQSGLNKILISLDGITQESYCQYRVNGELSKVIEGIKNLINQKKELKSPTPYVTIQFLVFNHNQHEIKQVKKLGKELGVNDVIIKSAQIYDYQEKKNMITNIDKYSRYKKNKSGNYSIKSKLKNHCRRIWLSSVVTSDGVVSPCCFDKNTNHNMGNLNTNTFKSIWKSPDYLKFKKNVLQKRTELEMCKNCTEGLKVPS